MDLWAPTLIGLILWIMLITAICLDWRSYGGALLTVPAYLLVVWMAYDIYLDKTMPMEVRIILAFGVYAFMLLALIVSKKHEFRGEKRPKREVARDIGPNGGVLNYHFTDIGSISMPNGSRTRAPR